MVRHKSRVPRSQRTSDTVKESERKEQYWNEGNSHDQSIKRFAGSQT